MLRIFLSYLVLTSCFLFTACSAREEVISPEPEVIVRRIVVEKPSPVPAGVVRYCWHEPIAKLEQNGPGLDSEGKWYHPSYQAVREVKLGKWLPCKPAEREGRGARNL